MTSIADARPEDEGAPAAAGGAAADAAQSKSDGTTQRRLIALPASDAELRAERDGPGHKPRPIAARLLDYSAHAAMIVGLIGFAWTISNHVVSTPEATHTATAPLPPTAAAVTTDKSGAAAELADLRRTNERLAADIGGLRAEVEALTSGNSRVPGQVKGLQLGMETLQSGLAAARNESAASLAQINSRLDSLAHEHGAALARPDADDASTGSLPPKDAPARPAHAEAVPLPPARADAARPGAVKPADTADAAPAKGEDGRRDADRAPIIAAYVVRDVTGGVALIEGRRGILEVVPGVSIPGAGVVKSIERCRSVERCGRGWTVITTKGQLASAAPLPVSRRDYRYSYRYDF